MTEGTWGRSELREVHNDSGHFPSAASSSKVMGASRLTEASPVLNPTLSGPNSRHSAIYFSLTSALIGHV